MFKLRDIRKTRVWQGAREEGIEVGIEKGIERGIEKGRSLANQELVRRMRANGHSPKEIGQITGMSLIEVRALLAAKSACEMPRSSSVCVNRSLAGSGATACCSSSYSIIKV